MIMLTVRDGSTLSKLQPKTVAWHVRSTAVLLSLVGLWASPPVYAAPKTTVREGPRHGERRSQTHSGVSLVALQTRKSNPNGRVPDGIGEGGANSDLEARSWSSAGESLSGNPAKDITNGVRVEDIVEPPADYHYASFGKSDPFVPPLLAQTPVAEKGRGPSTVEIPIVSALQRFPIDSLTIVGIWQHSNGDRKALILSPSGSAQGGQGVIVKAGDPIGNRGGKILAIGNDFIAVREFFLAPDGVRQYEDRRMLMTITPPEQRPARLVFKPGERAPKAVNDDQEVNLDDKGASLKPSSDSGSKAGQPRDSSSVMSQSTPSSNAQPAAGANPHPVSADGKATPGGVGAPSLGGAGAVGDPAYGPTTSGSPSNDSSMDGALSGAGSQPAAPANNAPTSGAGSSPAASGATAIERMPAINGIPASYIGGVVGASGRDITQPASSSLPTQ